MNLNKQNTTQHILTFSSTTKPNLTFTNLTYANLTKPYQNYFFHLFKDLSKLLVCGGANPNIDSCEVIDLESSATTCKNPPNFPAAVFAAVGGLGFKENPIICGGEQSGAISNRCYSLENNEWVSSDTMNSLRVYAGAVQLLDGSILVTGGRTNTAAHNSAEILTEEGWENEIPTLPVSIKGHCIVAINSTTVMIISGFNNDQISRKTFYFTFGEESWTEGPELKYARIAPCCRRIRRDKDSQEMSIIVAGGFDGSSYLSSIEILDEGSNEWKTGTELPFGMYSSQMVEDQNGGIILIGGYSSSKEKFDTLYQLPHGGLDAAWTKLEQKLKTGRYFHTAFLVPDHIVDCS
jgi:hypothetical protein